MMKRITDVSPRFKARMAGILYFFSLLTAGVGESLLHGGLGRAAGLAGVSGMIVITLLFYNIFKQVNRGICLLAAFINLVGLAFETLRLNPYGVDIALVFDGFYCILVGYLIFKSAFLPRILGALMAFAGLGWLTFVSLPLANHLSPYNIAAGILCEASVMLWLIVMGVNSQRWKEQAGAAALRE